MAWVDLATIIIPVAVTGLVAVLSARYGAQSAVEAAERQVQASIEIADNNNKAAEERIKAERLLQKREEIIETLYAHLQELEKQFLTVRTPHVGEDVRITQRNHGKFESKLGDTKDYFESRALWLDEETVQAIRKLLSDYLAHIGGINNLVYSGDERDFIPGNKEHYEATEKLNRWAQDRYPELQKIIERGLKSDLGIET